MVKDKTLTSYKERQSIFCAECENRWNIKNNDIYLTLIIFLWSPQWHKMNVFSKINLIARWLEIMNTAGFEAAYREPSRVLSVLRINTYIDQYIKYSFYIKNWNSCSLIWMYLSKTRLWISNPTFTPKIRTE